MKCIRSVLIAALSGLGISKVDGNQLLRSNAATGSYPFIDAVIGIDTQTVAPGASTSTPISYAVAQIYPFSSTCSASTAFEWTAFGINVCFPQGSSFFNFQYLPSSPTQVAYQQYADSACSNTIGSPIPIPIGCQTQSGGIPGVIITYSSGVASPPAQGGIQTKYVL